MVELTTGTEKDSGVKLKMKTLSMTEIVVVMRAEERGLREIEAQRRIRTKMKMQK